MNKQVEDELLSAIEGITESLKITVDNQHEFYKSLKKIVGLTDFLIKSISVIFFILGFLIWRVFLWDLVNLFLDGVSKWWLNMSDFTKNWILGIIGGIIVGLMVKILGFLILEKIKSLLKKN